MLPNHSISLSCVSIDQPKQQQQQQLNPIKLKFSLWHTFKDHIPRFIITVIIDVILPLLVYILSQKHLKAVYALLLAGSPPLLMVIFKAIWLRTFDALGFLVFFSFTITAMVAVIARNPIILLLEKSLITGVLSFIFGITLIPFNCQKKGCRWRPLAYFFYQDLVPTTRKDVGLPDHIFNNDNEQVNVDKYARLKDNISIEKLKHKQEVAQVYEWLYKHCLSFRYSCYLITIIWSIGYCLEFLGRLSLILMQLSVKKIVIYGHIILTTITALMIVLTIICITIERKFTLAFIEQWIIEQLNIQQAQQTNEKYIEMLTSFDRTDSDSDIILNIEV